MYTGLIYNDIFSKALHLGPSGWVWPEGNVTGLVSAIPSGTVYPFGLDPAWHGAENNLIFTNSFKMKLSIVLGVIHMTFAVCLQVYNHLYFKRPLSIIGNFIPEILFMESIFGYLVFTIVYKWSVDWSQSSTPPPGLLNMLIYMFLSPGSVDPSEQLFSGQAFVQVTLLLLALVCVPWMLALKPYMIHREKQKIKEQGYEGVSRPEQDRTDNEENGGHGNGNGEEEGEEEDESMSDIIVHQVIHTIEFCLGTIS